METATTPATAPIQSNPQPASAEPEPIVSRTAAAPPPAGSVVNDVSSSSPPPAAVASPPASVTVVKISVHERQGTGRFSRDAGYNGAFRLSVPRGGSRNLEILEVVEVYRDGELVREQTVTTGLRTPGTFQSKQRIQGLKTLDPGEYKLKLLFISERDVLGTYEWDLLVTG